MADLLPEAPSIQDVKQAVAQAFAAEFAWETISLARAASCP
jgi:hypothetical protein